MSVKILILDEDNHERWYSSPGDGYVYSEEDAHRYELSDFDFNHPGMDSSRCVLTAGDRKNVIYIKDLRIAPESVEQCLTMALRDAALSKLIKTGEEALQKVKTGASGSPEDFEAIFAGAMPFSLGVTEDPPEPEYEETTLESGQLVRHHPWTKCEPPCPLHARSNHPLVLADRFYNASTQMILRNCRHGVLHPDPDDIKVREMPHMSIHACCKEKCCKPKED